MIANKFPLHLEIKDLHAKTLFGFRANKSTEDVIYTIITHINSAQGDPTVKYSITICFDIMGAFDNAW